MSFWFKPPLFNIIIPNFVYKISCFKWIKKSKLFNSKLLIIGKIFSLIGVFLSITKIEGILFEMVSHNVVELAVLIIIFELLHASSKEPLLSTL